MGTLDLTNIALPEIKAGVENDVWIKLGATVIAAVILSAISFFLIKKAFA